MQNKLLSFQSKRTHIAIMKAGFGAMASWLIIDELEAVKNN